MKQKIIKILRDIEKEKKVKIIFAVESGSRAWGMDSKDSDYDVRFVFKRPLLDYISIDSPSDVIQRNFDKDGNRTNPEGCFIDVSGFDIIKFVRMLWSSNPTVIEWLKSDIIYLGEQNKVFKEFAENQFKKISLYFHYKSMCKQNYLKYIKSGNLLTYKKYLYAMRGLVCAKWVAHKGTLPNIIFPELLKKSSFIDSWIVEELLEIISLKKTGNEKDIVKNYKHIDMYIEEFLKDDTEAPREKQLSTRDELNKELKRIINE